MLGHMGVNQRLNNPRLCERREPHMCQIGSCARPKPEKPPFAFRRESCKPLYGKALKEGGESSRSLAQPLRVLADSIVRVPQTTLDKTRE